MKRLMALLALWMAPGMPAYGQEPHKPSKGEFTVQGSESCTWTIALTDAEEWIKRGQFEDAISNLGEAVRLDPASVDTHLQLAAALTHQCRVKDAIVRYRAALRLRPDSPEALDRLAWILATQPEAEWRNGTEAVLLAERACQQTGYRQPQPIITLAAAYAESGQFEEAVEAAQKARALASSLSQTNLMARSQQLLQQFNNREPYRDRN